MQTTVNQIKLITAAALVLGAFSFATVAVADDMAGMGGMSKPTPSTQPAGTVDLMNKTCPVSGDEVGDSKLTETYNGKTYHFCCDGCPAKFKKDPAKYEKAVSADPAKYGVKSGM